MITNPIIQWLLFVLVFTYLGIFTVYWLRLRNLLNMGVAVILWATWLCLAWSIYA